MYNPITISPENGGQLVTRISPEKGGEAGYSVKTNWRRDVDDEVRREGWNDFDPKGEGSTFPGTGDVHFVHLVRNPDGRICVVVAEEDKLWRYAGLLDGAYWESGYAEDDGVEGDEYVQSVLDDWEIIGNGFHWAGDGTGLAHRWEAVNVNGYTIFNNGYDLPQVYRADWYYSKPMYEMREAGIAKVDTIAEFNGFLICGDISEIKSDVLVSILSGSDPYGPITDSSLYNRVRYRIIWSGFGEPSTWGLTLQGSIEGRIFTCDHKIRSLYAGREFLLVGAGIDGGSISAKVLTWQDVGSSTVVTFDTIASTDGDIYIQDNSAEAQFVGYADLQDDSSKILRILGLRDRLVVYKDTANMVGFYTGSADAPFEFQLSYTGRKTLYYRWSLAKVNDVHVYPGRDSFYTFDLTSREPVEVEAFERCQNLFYDNVSIGDSDFVFAGVNQLTKEVWFNVPDFGVLAYYYLRPSVSLIDQDFTAFGLIERPQLDIPTEATEIWWLLGGPGAVSLYGLYEGEESIYTRDGEEYDSIIESSPLDLDDQFNEKVMRAYTPILATDSEVTISLYWADSPRGTYTLIGTRSVGGDGDLVIPVHALGLYFKDKILATGESNVRLSNRTFEFDVIGSRSQPRLHR